jgi:hypothetical protein
VTSRDTHLRASAGLLLVLVGANAGALPSLRLGVSWQPGFDWSAEMTDEAASGAREISFRRPTHQRGARLASLGSLGLTRRAT